MISSVATRSIPSPHHYSRQIASGGQIISDGVVNRVTIHHAAGRGTAAQIAANFTGDRVASAHYCIGTDGSCINCVDELDRPATSSNRINDSHAITIEVANCTLEPNWEVSMESWDTLIRLLVDICQRYPSLHRLVWKDSKDNPGNMTVHRWYAATNCPGPWLMNRMGTIAIVVNNQLDELEDEGDTNMSEQMIKEGNEMFAAMEDAADAREYDLTPMIDRAVKYGISDGTHPGRPATRGEVMAMMVRVFELLGGH